MTQRTRLNSGRVPVTLPANVTSDRYQFLGLDSAEPNLGTSGLGNVLTTNTSGSRIWTNQLTLSNLQVTGSASIGGNLVVYGNILGLGNVTQITTTITGNVGEFFGNVPTGFGALYAGISSGYVIEPQTVLQLSTNYNGYSQLNTQNINSGSTASTDFVATADNGNATVGFIDMGINSSTYSQSGYGLTGFNDGYLYVVGNTGVSSGNLVLSTYNSNADIIFSLGGGDTGNEIARFNNASKAFKVIGNIIATGYTNVGALYSPTIGNTGATLTGTIHTASQPNITALGTLGNLTITGNITAGNIIAGGVRQTTANVAPSNPTVGDQWYDTSTDILFKFTSDGTNYVWVDISSVALNTNVAIASYTQISASGNASVGTNLAVGNTLTVNSNGAPGAIINGGTSGVGNIGSSTGTFNIIFAKSTSSQYADLAEKYLADSDYEPGTVLVFGGSKEVTQSYKAYDTAVAGVVSTNPAHIMNDGIDGTAVALLGRVPCQVHGPINRGDLLVTSDTPGVAERLDETQWRPGCVIGKSLETMLENKTAIIEIVVGRI